ncbi:hypothetical protein HMPREF1155_1442 [Slackia sp. CM382]|nr:hypothetical protein HMPREF1155_1442 [Slackia sp. CM382]
MATNKCVQKRECIHFHEYLEVLASTSFFGIRSDEHTSYSYVNAVTGWTFIVRYDAKVKNRF